MIVLARRRHLHRAWNSAWRSRVNGSRGPLEAIEQLMYRAAEQGRFRADCRRRSTITVVVEDGRRAGIHVVRGPGIPCPPIIRQPRSTHSRRRWIANRDARKGTKLFTCEEVRAGRAVPGLPVTLPSLSAAEPQLDRRPNLVDRGTSSRKRRHDPIGLGSPRLPAELAAGRSPDPPGCSHYSLDYLRSHWHAAAPSIDRRHVRAFSGTHEPMLSDRRRADRRLGVVFGGR